MRIIRRLAACLLVFFTAISGTAILVGRVQTLPERLAMLHLTDCAPPCWIGITPGKTTRTEAGQKIQAVFNKDSGYTVRYSSQTYIELYRTLKRGDKIYTFQVACSFQTRTLRWCELDLTGWLPEETPSLAEVCSIWGLPQVVFWDKDSHSMAYFLIKLDVLIWPVGYSIPQRVVSGARVTTLRIYVPDEDTSGLIPYFRRWRGFASFNVYAKESPYHPWLEQ